MSVTDNQRGLLAEYHGFLEEGNNFTRSSASWRRMHDHLMLKITCDYQPFRTEARLWPNHQTARESAQRAGKQSVENS